MFPFVLLDMISFPLIVMLSTDKVESVPKLVITLPLTMFVPPIVIASASRVPSK